MPDPTPEERSHELLDRLEDATRAPREAIAQVGVPLLRLLMEGRPVSPGRLSAHTSLPDDKLSRLLERLGAERDERGRITGLALSLTPTPHQYEAEGRLLYGWCAADTLVLPGVLDHTASITSPDPVSEEPVKLVLSPQSVKQQNPSAAMIAWVREGDVSDMRQSFCKPGRFFAREETAKEWASRREGVEVVPLEEGFSAAQEIAEQVRSWTSPG